ncbi:MAG: hypothetical protein U0572_16860 [Phycisphaerales bacterium]
MATCPAAADAPPLRLVRLRADVCSSTSGLESARLPARRAASLVDPNGNQALADNTFAINDLGIVVGTYGIPADPCELPAIDDVLTPHAFLWLPRSASSLGSPSILPSKAISKSLDFEQALAFFGWQSAEAFAQWGASAEAESLGAVAETLRELMGMNQ